MHLEPVNIIHIVIAAQALIGIFILLGKARFKIFILLLSNIFLLMIFNILEENNVVRNNYLVTPVFSLGFGPLFYFYICQIINYQTQNTENHAWHLLPMLLALPFTHFSQVILFCGGLSQIAYAYFSIKLMIRYQQATQKNCSDADAVQLNWLIKTLLFILVISVVDLLRENLQPYLPVAILIHWYLVMTCLNGFIIAYLLVMSVRQPILFTGLQEFEQIMTLEHKQSQQQAKTIFMQIKEQLISHQWYLQPRFSLKDLAEYTGLHEKELSWAINQGGEQSFCDFINALRIRHIKQQLKLQQNQTKTILELAYASGFNSKSTFNAVFKKELGITPSQYLKNS